MVRGATSGEAARARGRLRAAAARAARSARRRAQRAMRRGRARRRAPFRVTITEPAAAARAARFPAVPPPRPRRDAPAGPTSGGTGSFASEAECERVRDDDARAADAPAISAPRRCSSRKFRAAATRGAGRVRSSPRARARDCLARRNVTRLYLIGDSVVRNLFHGLEALLGADGANAKPPSDRRALAQRPPAHIARLQQHLQPPPRHRAGARPLPPPTRAGGAAPPRRGHRNQRRAPLLDGAATLDYTEIWDESPRRRRTSCAPRSCSPPGPGSGSSSRRGRDALRWQPPSTRRVGARLAPRRRGRARAGAALRVWYGATAITALQPRYRAGARSR